MTKRRVHSEPRRAWSAEEDTLIRRCYPDTPTATVVAHLPGRSYASVSNRARKLGVSKSVAFLASPASGRLDGLRGSATRFHTAQRSWNAGTHWVAGGRSAETRFRKGVLPHNAAPVGTRVKTDDGYWKVKVADPKTWRFVHRMTWEDAHGPIPRDMALNFRDGNRDNCALDNLELVSRRDLMLRNTVHNLPAPLPQLVQLRGALVRKLNRLERDRAQQA